MRFKLVPTPSFVWVVVPILILLRLLGVLDTWTAVGIFVVYVVMMFTIMYRNPKMRAEAERFAQQVEEIRLQEKKHKLSETLRKSVRLQRRDAK